MRWRVIPKQEWQRYFDLFSRMAQGQPAKLEAAGDEIGDQLEKKWNLFKGLSYDSVSDTVYIWMPALEHAINSPEEIGFSENGAIKSISIKGKNGVVYTIHFLEPILLPSFETLKPYATPSAL